MTDYTPADFGTLGDADGVELRSAASTLSAAGIRVHAGDRPVSSLQEITGATDLRAKLGVGSEFTVDGRNAYLIALDLPKAGTGAHDAVTTEAGNASCTALLNRIAKSWTESIPNGRVRHYLALAAETTAEFESVIRTLPARTAVLDDKPVASLRFGSAITVAPSKTEEGTYRRLVGEAGEPKLITASELFGVGVVLDLASETRDRLARGHYDVRHHDSNTNRVRDRFNRIQAEPDVQMLIRQHGWERTGESAFASHWRRGDETGQLVDSTLTFVNEGTTGATLAGRAVTYRPFDLLVGLEMAIGKDGAKRVLESPEAAATWLSDTGQLSADIEIFSARGDIPKINSGEDTLDIVRSYASAVQVARSQADAATPIAFRRTVNGKGAGVISIAPSAETTRWTASNAKILMFAVAQYANITTKKDGEVKATPNHNLPDSIVSHVMMSLESPNVLRPVEYLASEPLITREGQVVSQHGYDMAAHAYISIPHRERAKWRADYRVPTQPTVQDVRSAYENLDRELLTDFPFSTPRDRARAMVYLLTCVGRSLTNGSIAFAVNAKDRGSGKSLLLLLGRILAQGAPKSKSFRFGKILDAETEKGLASLLLTSGRFFHCDETPRNKAVTGDVVTGLITSVDGDEDIRILGTNDSVTRGGVIVTCAGNQMRLGADLSRRFLRIDMEYAGKGSVLTRSGFRHDNIVAYVQQNRAQLLAWAHTILLYGAQNAPAHTIPGLGFNHTWAIRILGAASHIQVNDRQSLAQLTLEGWMEDVDTGDILSEAWGELLMHLWVKAKGTPKTAAELAKLSIAIDKVAGEERPELPPTLLGVSPSDSNAGARWASELGDVDGSRVPYNGLSLIIKKAEKLGASKRALTYSITCFAPDGEPILPGRDPYQVAAPAALAPVEPAIDPYDLEFS